MDSLVNIGAAFMVGLIGSMHCVGMCGPIAFALPLNRSSLFHKLTGNLLYNTGRIITYGLIGAFFGLIGLGFSLAGWQQGISVGVGVLLLLSVLFPKKWFNAQWGPLYSMVSTVKASLSQMFQKSSFANLFGIGLLNGLLPCGLVYVAVFGAVASGTIVDGVAYMLAFGLGTLPLMYVTAMAGQMINETVRAKFRKAIPIMVGVVALLFIVRGLGLNIPYLSPPDAALTPIKTEVKCH